MTIIHFDRQPDMVVYLILLKYDAENQESCIFMGIDFYDMGLRL